MRIPAELQPLLDDGIVDRVLRQLKSGKEAAVYVVDCGGEQRCAKVYKNVEQRSFQKVAAYREGRKSRRSRDERALGRHSRHGRKVQQEQWKNHEAEALRTLENAGVRVPSSYGMFDGVLLMEMLCDEEGQPAPRLNEFEFDADQAREWHALLIGEVVRMLCAGLIHGDLSEYNILVDSRGPVIIDLPQAVDAAGNNNAFRMLERDVNNLRATFGAMAPELLETEYAHEIWALYEANSLQPDSLLTGEFAHATHAADVDDVMEHIDEARWEAEARELGRQLAEAEADEQANR